MDPKDPQRLDLTESKRLISTSVGADAPHLPPLTLSTGLGSRPQIGPCIAVISHMSSDTAPVSRMHGTGEDCLGGQVCARFRRGLGSGDPSCACAASIKAPCTMIWDAPGHIMSEQSYLGYRMRPLVHYNFETTCCRILQTIAIWKPLEYVFHDPLSGGAALAWSP